jgi:hypothetical protein
MRLLACGATAPLHAMPAAHVLTLALDPQQPAADSLSLTWTGHDEYLQAFWSAHAICRLQDVRYFSAHTTLTLRLVQASSNYSHPNLLQLTVVVCVQRGKDGTD